MSRHDDQRLADITAAIAAIRDHLTHGELSNGLIFDAVRVRLIEIGEAVKGISPDLLPTEPSIPWGQVASMRDQLAHRYFDTAIFQARADVWPRRGRRLRRLAPRCARALTGAQGVPGAIDVQSIGCGPASTLLHNVRS